MELTQERDLGLEKITFILYSIDIMIDIMVDIMVDLLSQPLSFLVVFFRSLHWVKTLSSYIHRISCLFDKFVFYMTLKSAHVMLYLSRQKEEITYYEKG